MNNNNSEFLKIIGIVTMLIDHLGAVFYPQFTFFRIIGRLAFPIFAYQIGIGYRNTSNLKKYALRLFLLGILSQLPYGYLFDTARLNIFITLLIGLLAITVYDRINPALGMFVPFLSLYLDFDYGLYGVFTILFFFIFSQREIMLVAAQGFLNFVYCWWYNSYLQMYSLGALMIILFGKINLPLKINKFWFYSFYPLHLIILLLFK